MAQRFVPVTMGSPKFSSVEAGVVRVTHARFPPLVSLPLHAHAWPILAVILDGSWDEEFPRRTYECYPDTVLTEPAEERHANHFHRAGARVLVVETDPAGEEIVRPLEPLLGRAHCFRDGGVGAVARRLVREVHTSDAATPLAVEGLALELLALAARRRPLDGARGPEPPWLERAREFLHASFRRPIRLADVASVAGVHQMHLARVFRARYGASVGTYVRRLRLDWAAERLALSDDPLATIAMRAGFADQSHFTRAFKRHAGVTPGRYRQAAAAR